MPAAITFRIEEWFELCGGKAARYNPFHPAHIHGDFVHPNPTIWFTFSLPIRLCGARAHEEKPQRSALWFAAFFEGRESA